ncbi:hypothetical protein EYF80_050112 [Liparis tanakae]|uniref:Uncharacterized protein n=1 Tax=Liparis tanakae TaxID=230148 RepID=A0A4Z2FEN9_9TELE|nr:hypothetical protein EYF80_050112 [Liparis tanakae]
MTLVNAAPDAALRRQVTESWPLTLCTVQSLSPTRAALSSPSFTRPLYSGPAVRTPVGPMLANSTSSLSQAREKKRPSGFWESTLQDSDSSCPSCRVSDCAEMITTRDDVSGTTSTHGTQTKHRVVRILDPLLRLAEDASSASLVTPFKPRAGPECEISIQGDDGPSGVLAVVMEEPEQRQVGVLDAVAGGVARQREGIPLIVAQ